MNVVLLGYRGSGKTSAGRALAGRTGRTFVDADDRLSRRLGGLSIRQIIERDGMSRFRDYESHVLRRQATKDGVVFASGGGIILRASNRRILIEWARVRVYLHADAATLHRRIHADPSTATNRPALTHLGGDLREIESLLALREPLYREVATHTLDVSGLCVDEVAERLETLTADS